MSVLFLLRIRFLQDKKERMVSKFYAIGVFLCREKFCIGLEKMLILGFSPRGGSNAVHACIFDVVENFFGGGKYHRNKFFAGMKNAKRELLHECL